jgi:hypothetical protein
MKSAAFNLYDGNTDPDNQTIDEGQLTLRRNLLVEEGISCPETEATVDTSYSYDAYGNQVVVTGFSNYGSVTCDGSDNWSGGSPGGGSDPRSSTVVYDAYGLYPVAGMNPLGQVATASYDADYPWLPAP